MKGALKKLFGISLIVVGVVLWILPVVPGFVLILLGMEFLGVRQQFQEQVVTRAQALVPRRKAVAVTVNDGVVDSSSRTV